MTDGLDDVRRVFAVPEDVDLPEGLRPAAPGNGDVPPPDAPPEGAGDPPERACAALPLNDTGNGERFVVHFGADVIWVPRVGWFTWDGTVWVRDPDQIAVRRMAQRMGGLIAREVRWLDLPEEIVTVLAQEDGLIAALAVIEAVPRKDRTPADLAEMKRLQKLLARIEKLKGAEGSLIGRRMSFAQTTGNSDRIKNMLGEAGIRLAVDVDRLDAVEADVNTLSGVLRFSAHGGGDAGYSRMAEVTLLPHDRAHHMTKIMPVRWQPGQAPHCPLFDAFLAEVQPDPQMRAFLLRWLGLSMTAIPVQMLAFWYGAGANGKSLLADLVARIMAGYAATAKIKSLTGVDRRGGGDATPDLMLLIGARFVRASEPNEGEPLQEGLIKELTGGEPMMVRALHSDFVEFRPCFKLTVSGNHKPMIRGTDDGIWRRVLLVPWDVQIPESRRDKELGARLFDQERDGIFGRLVEGLLDYLEGGLRVPMQVSDATREFREESDPVGSFLDAVCVVTGEAGDSIGARELGEAFNYWLSEKGEGEWKPRTVAIKLKEKAGRWKSRVTGKAFVARKSSTMAYDGIRFNDVFARLWRDLPRDQTGRILRGRTAGLGDED